jgi:RND family efflux transporter MFP subunit
MIPREFLDPLAGTWGGALILASLTGGAALAVVWIVCRLWRTLPPRAACWLWRLAYLKLVLALIWTAPLRLPLLPPQPVETAAVIPAATDTFDLIVDPPRVAITQQPIEPARRDAAAELALGPIRLAGMAGAVMLLALITFVWLVGVLIASVRLLLRAVVAARLRRHARPVDHPALSSLCAALAATMGIRRPPPVLVLDDLAGPLLVGLFRPAIVLPAPAPDASSAELRQVLAHELAHLRRRDLGWNLLAAVADVLFFFHPLVWLARRVYRLAQESACDEAALGATDSAPADYARTLLAVAARGSLPAVAFAVGVVGARRTLERRILAMSRRSNWSRRRWALAAICVALVSLAALPPWRVVAQDKPAPTTREAKASPVGAGQRYVGRLVAETLRLQSPGDGVIQQVRVRTGDRVKKGDLILELDSQRAQAALAQAEAKLGLAQSQLTRVKSLYGEQHVASRAELDEKEAEVRIDQAEIVIRKHDLMDARVLAPFDGAVELTAQAGQQVTKGEALGRIIAVDAPRAMFQVPEDALRDIKVGRPVEVTVTAYPGRAFKAAISEVSPVIDPATATVTVNARFTESTEGLLPGMFANIALRETTAPSEGSKQ